MHRTETVAQITGCFRPVDSDAYFEVGAGAWILAGGTHHSCFSYDLTAEYWEDYAEIAGIEMIRIDKDTTISNFKKELRMNEVYYMLNKALC